MSPCHCIYVQNNPALKPLYWSQMSESRDNLIADLVKPGVVVAYYLSDGSTARARYPHDGARPVVEDVEATLALAKRTGKLLAVDSIDAETDATMDTFIVPQHVIAVRVEKGLDLAGVA